MTAARSVVLRNAATIAAVVLLLASCAVPQPQSPAVQAVSEASYAAGMAQLPMSDATRRSWKDPTAPRPVRTTIWYPASPTAQEAELAIGPPGAPLLLPGRVASGAAAIDGRKWPVILLSHGTGGSAVQMMWLGTELARHGFIAVAVDHHGNTAIEGEYLVQGFVLWWERARDLSFVLDTLIKDPQWSTRIDVDHIGAAGFSLGGYTAALLAGGRVDLERFRSKCAGAQNDPRCEGPPEMPDLRQRLAALQDDAGMKQSYARAEESWRDPRVRAVFMMAPAGGNALSPSSLQRIDIPVEIVVGEADAIAPPAENAQVIATAIPRTQLRMLPGVGHYTLLSVCGPAGVERMRALCADAPGVDRAAVHATVAAEAVRFFERRLAAR